jgi:hypothetical protein
VATATDCIPVAPVIVTGVDHTAPVSEVTAT